MIQNSLEKIICKDANFLYNTLLNNISKEVLDTNPVIAGGYIISVLSLPEVSNSIPELKNIDSFSNKRFNYGDIDLFYLNNNKLSPSVGRLLRDDGYYRLYNSKFSETYQRYDKITIGSLETYTKNIVQKITMKFESIEDIFRSFDMDNCKIAYYDKKIYFTESFIRSWKSRKIIYNKILKEKETVTDMVYQCFRLMKYLERYSLEISPSTNRYVINTFMELNSYTDEDFIDPESVWLNYRGEEEGEPEYDSKYEEFMEYGLDLFLEDETFGGMNVAYLIDNKNERISEKVKSLLNLE